MPFNKDDRRTLRCACGYEGTMAQVRGHRSRKVYAECVAQEPTLVDDPDAQGNGVPAPDDSMGEREEAAGADAEARSSPVPSLVPPTKTRGIGRPDVVHITGFTPVRAQYAFPAQMHALHDFFVSEGYEGTFQDWVTEIVLKCCGEHYRLRYGVYVDRPAPAGNGVKHG